jgi:hypothetical protein
MHYLPKLYATMQLYIHKHDYDGMQNYFSKHVAPVFDRNTCEDSRLESIEDEQLRNLVQITFGQLGMTMRHVSPELSIDGIISIPSGLSMLVFEIMSNLIDNALQHIKFQQRGFFRLTFTADDVCLIISITNSLTEDKTISALLSGRTLMGRGFGLRRVRQVAINAPKIELYTYKRGQFEGMPLLTQLIKIRLGDGYTE